MGTTSTTGESLTNRQNRNELLSLSNSFRRLRFERSQIGARKRLYRQPLRPISCHLEPFAIPALDIQAQNDRGRVTNSFHGPGRYGIPWDSFVWVRYSW